MTNNFTTKEGYPRAVKRGHAPLERCPRCEDRFNNYPHSTGGQSQAVLWQGDPPCWICDGCGLIFDQDGNKRTFDA